MKAFNEKTYLKDLDSLKWLNYINFASVNEIYKEFHSKLIAVRDKNASHKTLSKQESKTKQKSWIAKSIIKSSKTKNIIKSSWKHNWNSGIIDTNLIETLLTN